MLFITVADAPVLPVCCRWKPPKVLGWGMAASSCCGV